MLSYICHSGGCPGADMVWETECKKYNINTISYSFLGHQQIGEHSIILSDIQLKEGYEQAKIADKTLHRNLDMLIYPYVRHLIERNWYQVKNSEAIFAIGTFENDSFTRVNGGTGWTVQMAIDNKKQTFFFNQDKNQWNMYFYPVKKFKKIDFIPTLLPNFAGIGTRAINDNGINAIKNILKCNFLSQKEEEKSMSLIVKYRDHRGGFDESMATKKQYTNVSDLMYELRADSVEWYGKDERLQADCFAVKNKLGVLGFLWFEESKELK